MRRRGSRGVVDEVLDAPGVAVIARILLTGPFLISALLKLLDFPAAIAEAAHFGLRPAPLFAVLVIVLQAAGSTSVIFSRRPWLGAGALGVFTVLASLVGHAFWTQTDPATRFHELNAFLANMGLVGGLSLAAILHRQAR